MIKSCRGGYESGGTRGHGRAAGKREKLERSGEPVAGRCTSRRVTSLRKSSATEAVGRLPLYRFFLCPSTSLPVNLFRGVRESLPASWRCSPPPSSTPRSLPLCWLASITLASADVPAPPHQLG